MNKSYVLIFTRPPPQGFLPEAMFDRLLTGPVVREEGVRRRGRRPKSEIAKAAAAAQAAAAQASLATAASSAGTPQR